MSELRKERLKPDAVVELRDQLAAAFMTVVGEEQSVTLGKIAEACIRHQWGGLNIYVAKGTHYHTEWIREEVRRRWNGRNTVELCCELRISARYLMMLAKQARDQ